MKPIAEMPAKTAREIRWVLTDIDDTMTKDGVLSPAAFAALCDLAAAGLRVIAVTGRSAGWARVHMQEWPIVAAIAENGGIAFARNAAGNVLAMPFPGAVPNSDPRFSLAATLAFEAVSRARPASDNDLRAFDYAIDHAERVCPPLSDEEVATIVGVFERAGFRARPSSIHVNCWMGDFDKLKASLALLSATEGYDDSRDREFVCYVGDAPNDEEMFAHFPASCAVANVSRWLDRIDRKPAWVSLAPYGEGFAEIARVLLAPRASPSRRDP